MSDKICFLEHCKSNSGSKALQRNLKRTVFFIAFSHFVRKIGHISKVCNPSKNSKTCAKRFTSTRSRPNSIRHCIKQIRSSLSLVCTVKSSVPKFCSESVNNLEPKTLHFLVESLRASVYATQNLP